MYELPGLIDQKRFSFDQKNKQWEIHYLVVFNHGSLKDAPLIGVIVVHLSEHGEVINVKVLDEYYDELDDLEEFLHYAKTNKYVQERIQLSQWIIKERNRLNVGNTIGKVKDFTYEDTLGFGKMYLQDEKLCFVFGWEKTKGLHSFYVEYPLGDGDDVYHGSHLDLLKESVLEPKILKQFEHEMEKRLRVRFLFTN